MATFDWSIDQPNVVTVPEPNMTVLSNDNEQYIVRYVNPKGCVEQRLVTQSSSAAPIGARLDKNLGYSMTVQLDNQEPVHLGDNLTLEDHSIWQGSHGIASKLSAGKEGFTLWPGNHAVQSKNLTVPADYDGTLKINVKLSDGQSTSLHAVYPELASLQHESSRQLSADQLDFQKKFRRGDPRLSAMLPNIHALCGEDVSGNQVKLFWHVKDDKEAQLVDIEYPVHRLGAPAYSGVQTIKFACDPSDLDQVTGLVMALEDKMAAGELEGPVIQQVFDTIETHRKTLESDQENALVTPKVNAAVKEATDALWQTIDGQARQRRYFDKLLRGGGAKALEMADDLYQRMVKARAYGRDELGKAKKGPKKWIASSRKSMIRKEIEDFENAIMRMKQQDGLSTEQVALYDKALDSLKAALKL